MNVSEIMHGTSIQFETKYSVSLHFVSNCTDELTISCSILDIKNLCDNVVRLLVGKTSTYKGWSRDDSHRRHCEVFDVFPETKNGGALPWRLTAAERASLDARTANIAWAHYIEPLYYHGASFWEKPSRMWKSRRKYRLLLFFLPVLLRDQVPRLRTAIVLLASALRRLDGQVHSYQKAKSLGILPGSRAINRAEVDAIEKDLIRALVLLEGCVPVTYLIPSMHHLVHYGEYTKTHGVLRIYWMMAFERYPCHCLSKMSHRVKKFLINCLSFVIHADTTSISRI